MTCLSAVTAEFSVVCNMFVTATGEEDTVRRMLMHAPYAVETAKFTDPHTKANALLQARP